MRGVLLDPRSGRPERPGAGIRLLGYSDDDRVLDDIEQLKWIGAKQWKSRYRGLVESGIPQAHSQGFRGIPLVPGGPKVGRDNETTVTGVTVITALWNAANRTPIPANWIDGGEIFEIFAYGVMTTAVTGAQTVTFTPIFGTTTGGTSLGASIAAPLEAKVFTNTQWNARMVVHFRQGGSGGLATCSGTFEALPLVGVAAGTAEGGTVPFGTASTTPTTVDTTAAAGLLLCVTPSLATQSYTALGVVPESLN